MHKILVAILCYLSLASASFALSLSDTPATKLLSGSDLVIHGRVQSSQIWLRPNRGWGGSQDQGLPESFILHTLYQVEVLETFDVDSAAKIGDSVTVILTGGNLDKGLQDQMYKIWRSKNLRVWIVPGISFKPGEEVILFLEEQEEENGIYSPRSGHQGVVRIVNGEINPNPSLVGIERGPLVEGLELLRRLSRQ